MPESNRIRYYTDDVFNDAPRWSQYLLNKRKLVILDFIDSCLRGAAQVVFMNNPISGIFILIGLAVQNPFVCIGAIIGLVSNTLAAKLFGINKDLIRAGLHGYNGTLVGAALATFITPQWKFTTILIIIYVSLICFLIHIALSNFLSPYGLPVLTMPFNLSTLIFLFGALDYNWYDVSFEGHLLNPFIDNDFNFVLTDVLYVIPRGIGQVYLCDNWLSGLLIWIGILISSRIGAIFAVVGSCIGIIMAYILGASYSELLQGLWCYNPVLGAMAIGGYFYHLNWKTTMITILCGSTTCLLFGMIKNMFTLWGIPSCTMGFCLGTFIFLFQRDTHKFFQPIPLGMITTHDKNWVLTRKLRENSQVVSVNEVEFDSRKSPSSLNEINELRAEIEKLKQNYETLLKDFRQMRTQTTELNHVINV